jgi:hypothetical protein
MKLFALSGMAFIACEITFSAAALAGPCPGVFIRDSQSYDNRNAAGTLEKIDVVVPAGTRDDIVGYVVVEGREWFVQYRAYLHDPADIRLKAGCKLDKYED